MWRLRRKGNGGGAAVASRRTTSRPTTTAAPPSFGRRSTRLTAANRERRDVDLDRRVLWLRHVAGMRALDGAAGGAEFAAPDAGALPAAGGLPEFARAAI